MNYDSKLNMLVSTLNQEMKSSLMSSLKNLSLKINLLKIALQKLSFLVSVFIFFIFSFSAQGFYRVETITEEDQPVSHAIWNIKVGYNYYTSKKMGTAFFISPTEGQNTTQVITSLHAIESLLKPSHIHLENLVLTHHNLKGVFRFKKILRLSHLYDLALLEVDQASPSFLDLVENPSPSDNSLYVIGYHNSGHSKESEFDKFEQTSPLIDLDYGEITINHSNLKGLSGSPVLLNGKVRGVVSISLQNLLNFISVNDMKAFLKEDTFLCHSSFAKECLNSAKELFIKSPQQDLKYYYNLLLSVFTSEIIRSKKTEEEKKEFWRRFETAIAGLEKLKQRKNNPLLFHLLSEYYRFNSYRFSFLETNRIDSNSKKRRHNLEKGALSGDRYSQYILSYIENPEELPIPLLSSSKVYWLLKAGQNYLSQAQYEIGETYYKYHQNPFLNDFILKSVLYEDSRLSNRNVKPKESWLQLESVSSPLSGAYFFEKSSLLIDSKDLLFNPSLNFKTKLSQWLSATNPEILQQAQSDFFQKTKFHHPKKPVSYFEEIGSSYKSIKISYPLLELSNPYNPYNELNGINSAPERNKSLINPPQANIYYQPEFYDFYGIDGLVQEYLDFPLFEYQNQRKSLLAPEDQQLIQSYQDLLSWISDKEKKVYEVMSHIRFHKKLSEITGCKAPQSPPFYKPSLKRDNNLPFFSFQNLFQLYFNQLKEINDETIAFRIPFESFLDEKLSIAVNFLLGKYWLIKAAEQGHADAQYLLAELYAKNKNRALAEYWLIKALNQNEEDINRHSLYLLGLMYANIKEVNKKRETCLADFWLRSAIAHYDYRAVSALKKMQREETNLSNWEEGNHITSWYKQQQERKNPKFDTFKNFTGEFSNSFLVAANLTEEQISKSFMGFHNKSYDDSIDSLWEYDENISFNEKAQWRGEVLLNRNSPLLNQNKETNFYEFFHYKEPVWIFKDFNQNNNEKTHASFNDNKNSENLFLSTPTTRLEIALSSLYTSEEVKSFFDLESELKTFLKQHPESIYKIAEESSLLWSDKDFN